MSTVPVTVPPSTESAPPAKLLLNIAEVAALLGLAERTLWRWVSSHTFPTPDVSLGKRIRRWRPETIQAWVAAGGRV